MLCPNCGNETPDNFEFCANCGAKLIKEIEQPQESKNGLKFIRCRNCGKEMLESFEFCASCGAKLKTNEQTKYKTVNYNVNNNREIRYGSHESKTGLGVLLAILLGVIGLIVGICLYPEGSYARKSFIKAWVITFAIEIGITVLLLIILLSIYASSLAAFY